MDMPDFSRLDPDLLAFLDEQFGKWNTRQLDIALSGPLQAQRGVSRQAAAALLNRLVSSKVLAPGKGLRPKTYTLNRVALFSRKYKLQGLEEHVVWHEDLEPLLAKYASPEAMKIWSYGITEMINNATDHSEGSEVSVVLLINAVSAECIVTDNGEGIFRRITRLCELIDEKQAILELSKGKLTTAPQAHTGEGIFFTSRAMDWFDLTSHGLSFNHVDDEYPDFLLENDDIVNGTCVMMDLNHRTKHNLRSLFHDFAAPDSFSFNKTIVPVRLAKIGVESLISRSQARRLLARIERFEHVMFDFSEIDAVGQAFADEIFRVFQNEHPEVELEAIQANDEVTEMINRARAHK